MIRGKRITLRKPELDDQPFIHALNSDPVVRGNVVGWDWPGSRHSQERWFVSSDSGSTHRWLVEHQGDPIGLTGLWDVNWHDRNAESALKIGGTQPDLRGQGLGSDAIKTVMAFAFYDVGLARLHTTILPGNTASLRAYTENCGWQVEGRSRQHVWRHGQFHDLVHVGVLREDFDRLPDASEYIALATGAYRVAR